MNPASADPVGLLSEAGQWTEPWGGSDDGADCDKCQGERRTTYECWSCLLTGAKPDCPVCAGRISWEDECPVCRGSGRIDGSPRHGVSVFPTLPGLYHYMLTSEADLDGCVVVELEGRPSGDVDFDADQGAMLVIPTAVLACHEVDRRLAEEVERQTTEHAPD
jgi:hypothetical protein